MSHRREPDQPSSSKPLLVCVGNFLPVLRMFRRMEGMFSRHGYDIRLACDIYRTYNQARLLNESLDFVGLLRSDSAESENAGEMFRKARLALDLDSARRARNPRHPDLYVRRALQKAKQLFNQWNASGLVLWNGLSFWHQVLALEAAERGIPVCYLENGYFPGTLCIDREGINFGSSRLRQDPPVTFDAEKVRQFVLDFREQQLAKSAPPRRAKEPSVEAALKQNRLRLYAMSLSPLLSEDQRLHIDPILKKPMQFLRGDRLSKNTLAAATDPLPTSKTIFLPLQVENDTQITLYSDWIRSMEQLVEVVVRAMPEGYRLVVRDHPEDRKNRSYDKIIKLVTAAGGAWAPYQDLLSIIRNSSLVITVNSTVGFEALLWDKPVVTLGRAFYEGRGGSLGAHDESELPQVIERALSEPIVSEDRERLLSSIAFLAHCRGGLGFLDPLDQAESVECILRTLK